MVFDKSYFIIQHSSAGDPSFGIDQHLIINLVRGSHLSFIWTFFEFISFSKSTNKQANYFNPLNIREKEKRTLYKGKTNPIIWLKDHQQDDNRNNNNSLGEIFRLLDNLKWKQNSTENQLLMVYLKWMPKWASLAYKSSCTCAHTDTHTYTIHTKQRDGIHEERESSISTKLSYFC